MRFLQRIFDRVLLFIKFVIKYLFYYRVDPKRLIIYPPRPLDDLISVVIPTHGALAVFKRCLSEAIRTAGYENTEFIIWDNNAPAETKSFLAAQADTRIRVIQHPKNIGLNAFHFAFKEARGSLFVCLDHDVIKFQDGWLQQLSEHYCRVPSIRFLASDVVSDHYTDGARHTLRSYQHVERDGLAFRFGAVGGWCSITDREIYESVGGFPYFPEKTYFLHDKFYVRKLLLKRHKIAIDQTLHVYHARGLTTRIESDDIFRKEFFSYVDELSL